MLGWALTFLLIAIVAGVLGFGILLSKAAWVAKVLFFVFLVVFILTLFTGRRSPIL